MENRITIGNGILWVLIWFGFMLLYTLLDIAVWRKIVPTYEKYLNVITIALSMAVFLRFLSKRSHFRIDLFRNTSFLGVVFAIGCVVFLYFLLDKGIDPILERFFPISEASYQETLQALSKAPVVSLFQICILAPIIEEILMRGYLLNGLSASYGNVIALLVSSLLFALLHFNMVQTFSAFVCGVVLGLLYLQTGSVFCCILTHAGYNLVSFITMILPLIREQ